MPARHLPHNHRRTHSWPPLSTRHLLSVAPVHFHLNPNPKKRSASPPPLPPPAPRAAAAVSKPLPDIDDDPFAHFLSPMTDEDNPLDALSFSAGIIIADGGTTEKKDKLKTKLARRWAKYVAKCHAGRNAVTGREAGPAGPAPAAASAAAAGDNNEERMDGVVDEGYMSEDAEARMDKEIRAVRPGPSPLAAYKTVVREPTRGRAQELVERSASSKRRKFRHSWRAPDRDLFTVVEEGEGGDSEIEQRYFSV